MMNPNAYEWKPTEPTPSGPEVVAEGTPVSEATAETTTPPPTPSSPDSDPPIDNQNIGVDESDPLWIAVIKLAEGDRDKALRMLNDPDQLALYPEIAEILADDRHTGDLENNDTDVAEQLPELLEKATLDDSLPSPGRPTEESSPTKENAITLAKSAESASNKELVAEEEDEKPPEAVVVKEGDPREHLNLVFIGHVDAGKSTLSGNILYLTENVDKRTIERYEKEAKERNRDSWFLAFIMDTNEEERAKGKTVEVGKACFATEVKRYTILDAPGHKNYVPNMIQGASQADVAILVISARKGEFETGFDRGGQTREHAMLAKTLGVSYLIVVVNKMDEPTVQWKKERFDECVTKIRPFLKSCGFVIKREVKFIPISGLAGENVKDEIDSSICSWWRECYTKNENNTSSPTLLKLLDTLEIKDRNPNAPLRLPVLDRYNDRGTIAMGKVESGTIRPGMKITVMPTRTVFKVDEVWADEDPVSAARPGENVLVRMSGAKIEEIRRGYVICTEPLCRAVTKIICQIAIADMPDHTRVMTAGFQCIFHAHAIEEECTVNKIFETTTNKGLVNKQARFASVGMRAVIMLELNQTIPVETYDHMPFLGRFTLRTEGKTVAIGKIIKLPPKKE